ncbi:MAG: hypothetical protein ACYCR7_01865 [Thermoplasmataceae archaeon]
MQYNIQELKRLNSKRKNLLFPALFFVISGVSILFYSLIEQVNYSYSYGNIHGVAQEPLLATNELLYMGTYFLLTSIGFACMILRRSYLIKLIEQYSGKKIRDFSPNEFVSTRREINQVIKGEIQPDMDFQ